MLKYYIIKKYIDSYLAEKQEIKQSVLFAFGNINSDV